MKSRFVLVALFSTLALPLVADEGMWMPEQIPALAGKLRAKGFSGDPNAFADLTGQPMGAIVSLGNCSASFVSPEGLIVTNHHCAVGALQYNSTPERNILKEGFLAKTKGEEVSNGPGYRVFVTNSYREVTPEITGKIDAKLDDRKRWDLIERRVKERTKACEADGSRCRIASFYGGEKYYEIAQTEIPDVRLVYAPPYGVGVFGGETDNWRWPRHTGDWSFYRAYVGKDGKPAPYSKDNVPYKPKHWLKVSAKGVRPHDLVFVAGYPGRTERLQTFEEVKETTDWLFPRSIRRSEAMLALLDELSKGKADIELKVAPRKRGLGNSLTNRKGMLEGLVKGGILNKKEAEEKALAAWIAADPARQKEYGSSLAALAALDEAERKTRDRDAILGEMSRVSPLYASARTLYRLSLERPKKDIDREIEFQERNVSRIKDELDRMQKTFDAGVDRALLRQLLLDALALPATQRIEPLDRLAGITPSTSPADAAKALDAALDKLYAGTKLGDKDVRLSLLTASTAELAARKDTFLDFAAAMEPLSKEIRETEKTREGTRSRLVPVYMRALLARGGGLVAPDANSTLRVTFGSVEGVDAKDGLYYQPQTTLRGILEKNTGSGDFDAPKKEIDAIKALRAGKSTPFADPALHDVPVNFLSTVDTTGGNSGSATLNSQGELVGLLFDGTYDTIASDFLYDPVRTRSIHVDVRYLLWNMADVDGAANVLEEIGVR